MKSKHQTQHEKDKKSYAAFIKKNGNEPAFTGTTEEQKAKFGALHKKWVSKWAKWSKK